MENKTESVTPETASKGDSQPVSLTKELKEDVKVVTQVLKQKSIKTAGIFALIAAGLWLIVLIFTAFSHANDYGTITLSKQILTIVSFVFFIGIGVLLWISWKKLMATNESFKFRDMCKKFLLISIIVVGVSIFLQIFYIAGAFAAFDYDYWKPILALLSILAFGGIGLSVASGIMLIMPSTNRQSEPTGDQ